MSPPQIPSLSREVHFVLPNLKHRTAKVINTHPVNPETPTLKIELDPFTDTLSLNDVIALGDDAKVGNGSLVVRNVPYDETGQTVGSWHFPERT